MMANYHEGTFPAQDCREFLDYTLLQLTPNHITVGHMIEKIIYCNLLYAIIIPASLKADGIQFPSDNNDYLQVGYMQRPKDYVIKPHTHNVVKRMIDYSFEVLFIKRGKVRVDFFHPDQTYYQSRIIKKGDTILLGRGGHGFKMLEESEITEVKQGPYIDVATDKVKFESVEDDKVIYGRPD